MEGACTLKMLTMLSLIYSCSASKLNINQSFSNINVLQNLPTRDSPKNKLYVTFQKKQLKTPPSTPTVIYKSPGLFFDTTPFQVARNHNNPTVFNFPSFSVVDRPKSGHSSEDIPVAAKSSSSSSLKPFSNNLFNIGNDDSFSETVLFDSQNAIKENFFSNILKNNFPELQNGGDQSNITQNVFSSNDQFRNNIIEDNGSIRVSTPQNQSHLVNSFDSNKLPFSSLSPIHLQLDASFKEFPPPPLFTESNFSNPSGPHPFIVSPEPFPSPFSPPLFPNIVNFPPFQMLPDRSQNTILESSLSGFEDDSLPPFDPTFPGPPTPKRYQPEVGGSCISFTGERGLCLGMDKCPALRPLVKQLYNKELLIVLLNNVCRLEGSAVYFCCEFPAFHPGEKAKNTRLPAFIRSPHGAPLPQEGECGRKGRRGKIIGGENTKPYEWPWLAAVGRPSSHTRFIVDCGGALITRRHVLTAASCFAFPEFFQPTHIRLGEHDYSRRDDRSHVDYIIVGRNEPGFLAPTAQNNLMIITLGGDVQFTDYVRPVCLPLPGSDVPSVDSFVILAGWGLTALPDNITDLDASLDESTPMHIEQEVVNVQNCQEAYNDPETNFRVIDHRSICVRRDDEDGVCIGDGGGPIVQAGAGGSYVLVGVVSTTAGCVDDILPSLGTKVAPYMDWVRYVVQGP